MYPSTLPYNLPLKSSKSIPAFLETVASHFTFGLACVVETPDPGVTEVPNTYPLLAFTL
ncbi:hypothetical protein D3C86_1872220 [compost metagenome]